MFSKNLLFTLVLWHVLGGNQRDLARQKNQKKLQELGKGKRSDNLTVEQRKAR